MTRTSRELARPFLSSAPNQRDRNTKDGKVPEISVVVKSCYWGQGRLQRRAACAAAEGDKRVGTPIPSHKFENSRALYGCLLEHSRKKSQWKVKGKHPVLSCRGILASSQ
ncbi:hypothetical protein AVEN_169719-1 [Araneus ventricosus]|uniref:Uncharacterized protein n=1 Tax=Araneus ventricosus TaxID=182803 RepID=A0A4Y1ZN99_ARAVE|nr:hypothetical protein AVEN_264800-1 [Araneus ventricosus]GBL60030.1 hypothetical protein AVEN_38051-1 [Araneus ventricosus]GBL60070.1 hypothetical protein AVEN_107062-1 [Araneus ventricosus]GBL60109.1 hypothetical protein AVEN_169719-1 [Araneus ventricosus]